jgi:hypothetical protein
MLDKLLLEHNKNEEVKNVISVFNPIDYFECDLYLSFKIPFKVFKCDAEIRLYNNELDYYVLYCPTLKNMILTGYFKNFCIKFDSKGNCKILKDIEFV